MTVKMVFYVSFDAAGNVHVQNMVGTLAGQHHVHTPDGFVAWRKDSDDIRWREGAEPCRCGLAPGQVRDGWPP